MPARRVARLDLRSNRPCLADLRAQWRVIERAQELSVELWIVEIDFHGSCSLVTLLSIRLQDFHRCVVAGNPADGAAA